MRPININKTLKFEEGSIEIRYNGMSINDTIDLDKINVLLEDFIKNHNHDSMIENVTIVRTILKDYEEKLLVIYYSDEKGSELVKYDNSNLFLYEKNKIEEKRECFNKYKIKYEQPYGIKLDYNSREIEFADSIELASKEIPEMLQQIYYLKNIKAIVLDKDDEILIKIYKCFYNENPDFSSKDINVRVQTMMFILSQFGFSLGDNYGFHLYGKVKMPISLELRQKVNRLYPLGEISIVENSIVEISEEAKKIIKIVGRNIREAISCEQSEIEALITISRVIYSERYYLSANSSVKKISEFTDCTLDQVESCLKLVKCIESKINK